MEADVKETHLCVVLEGDKEPWGQVRTHRAALLDHVCAPHTFAFYVASLYLKKFYGKHCVCSTTTQI